MGDHLSKKMIYQPIHTTAIETLFRKIQYTLHIQVISLDCSICVMPNMWNVATTSTSNENFIYQNFIHMYPHPIHWLNPKGVFSATLQVSFCKYFVHWEKIAKYLMSLVRYTLPTPSYFVCVGSWFELKITPKHASALYKV